MDNTEKNNEIEEQPELQEPEEINNLQKEKSKIRKLFNNQNPWLIIISALLLLIIIMNFISLITSNKRIREYDEIVEDVQQSVNLQQSAISSLMDDFEEAVYDNPNVDNIYQQQFRAAEFNIVALQLIAFQNSQIIELLSALP